MHKCQVFGDTKVGKNVKINSRSMSESIFVNRVINDTPNSIMQRGSISSQFCSIRDNIQWVETGQVSRELKLSAAVQNAW